MTKRKKQPTAAEAFRVAQAAPALLAALERYLDHDCPFMADADSCECGENGNGRDDKGNVCVHIEAHRAIAKATAAG